MTMNRPTQGSEQGGNEELDYDQLVALDEAVPKAGISAASKRSVLLARARTRPQHDHNDHMKNAQTHKHTASYKYTNARH